jgi:hypothetical protein
MLPPAEDIETESTDKENEVEANNTEAAAEEEETKPEEE